MTVWPIPKDCYCGPDRLRDDQHREADLLLQTLHTLHLMARAALLGSAAFGIVGMACGAACAVIRRLYRHTLARRGIADIEALLGSDRSHSTRRDR
jgi:hypothetical protein